MDVPSEGMNAEEVCRDLETLLGGDQEALDAIRTICSAAIMDGMSLEVVVSTLSQSGLKLVAKLLMDAANSGVTIRELNDALSARVKAAGDVNKVVWQHYCNDEVVRADEAGNVLEQAVAVVSYRDGEDGRQEFKVEVTGPVSASVVDSDPQKALGRISLCLPHGWMLAIEAQAVREQLAE